LEIPTWLISKYTEAYVFKTNNLAKVQAADAFAASLSPALLSAASSNEVANYVLYKDATPQTYLDSGAAILNGLASGDYFPPSILGFIYDEKGPDATNLWVLIPVRGNYRPGTSFDTFPAIWHENKWRLSDWDMRFE
jgi:hypothetical protein